MAGTIPDYNHTAVVYTWFSEGYNIYYLPTSMTFPKGSLAYSWLPDGTSFLINRNANAVYSDYNNTGRVSLNTNSSDTNKWCFYINLITVGKVEKTINISKNYGSPGSYNLSANLVCDNSSISLDIPIRVNEGN